MRKGLNKAHKAICKMFGGCNISINHNAYVDPTEVELSLIFKEGGDNFFISKGVMIMKGNSMSFGAGKALILKNYIKTYGYKNYSKEEIKRFSIALIKLSEIFKEFNLEMGVEKESIDGEELSIFLTKSLDDPTVKREIHVLKLGEGEYKSADYGSDCFSESPPK